MKTEKRILALTIFAYLIGAFIAGDWNSANWAIGAKSMLAFFYVCSVVGVLAYGDYE